MLIHSYFAVLSSTSRDILLDMFSGSPFTFETQPVEIYASTDIINLEMEGEAVATTVSLGTPYDNETQSSPAVLLLDSPDLQKIHQELRDHVPYAWPYDYFPHMQLNYGSMPHRRFITSFLNSLSDTFNRNPVTLVFDRFYTSSRDVQYPPFNDYFQQMSGMAGRIF